MEPTSTNDPTIPSAGTPAPAGKAGAAARAAGRADQPAPAGNASARAEAAPGANNAPEDAANSPSAAGAATHNWIETMGLQKLVDQLPQGVRDFCTRSWGQVMNLSTTQKVAGAAALAGLGYLALRGNKSKPHAAYRGEGRGYRGAAYGAARQSAYDEPASYSGTSYRSGSSSQSATGRGYESSGTGNPDSYGTASRSGADRLSARPAAGSTYRGGASSSYSAADDNGA